MITRLWLLKPIFLIILVVFSIEAVLEYRHYRMGFDTPIFGRKLEPSNMSPQESENPDFGPTNQYPFRSEILTEEKGSLFRLWIASASHAEHYSLPADTIFPNQICRFYDSPENKACEVMNGSKAGVSVKGNIALLESWAPRYRPDKVLLYQLPLIIEYQQGSIIENSEVSQADDTNSIIDMSAMRELFQSTSLHQHLTDYIGGNLNLQGFMNERLPERFDSDFEAQIMSFLDACKRLGTLPILSTFAASHDESNLDSMPQSVKTNFVRYGNYLSPMGWVNMIRHYNEIIRSISQRENVALIDVESALGGRPEYFIDFVHFNSEGHAMMASVVANALSEMSEMDPKSMGADDLHGETQGVQR